MNSYIRLATAIAISSFFTPAHAEKEIYKCSKPDGSTVFSPTPCAKNAKAVDTSAALRAGTSPNLVGVSDRAAIAGIDSECAAKQRTIDSQGAADVANADADIRRLEMELRRSSNNYAGATRDNGLREQISAAQSRKDEATGRQRTASADLSRDCAKLRSDELKREAERDAAANAVPVR